MNELIMQWQINCNHKRMQISCDQISVLRVDYTAVNILIIIGYYLIYQAQQQPFVTFLSNLNFCNLKTLTIYYSSWQLANDNYQDMICETLMKLPKLKLFTMIVSNIKSDVSFKPLGDRFKAIIDNTWHFNEEW